MTRTLKNFDFIIFILVNALIAIGLIALSSATAVKDSTSNPMLNTQLIWVGICYTVAILVMLIDYAYFGVLAPYIYILMLIPLCILIFLPHLSFVHSSHNATSWFKFGNYQLQPSEFAKVIFILTFARHLQWLHDKGENAINKLLNVFLLLMHAAIPTTLIMLQPDNGTALVFCFVTFTMLFAGGLSYKYILGIGASAAVALPLMFFYVLPKYAPHAMDRILTFLNPALDPKGAGWQASQSKIAIGSGRITGMGYGNGIISHLEKGGLPVKESDFIYAVIGEELGFVISALVILLFTLLILRMIFIAKGTKDFYGSMIIIGVTTMIAFHMFQNIGMTIGLMPITGIPLPFISYGGSSMLTNFIAIALVMNVKMHQLRVGFLAN